MKGANSKAPFSSFDGAAMNEKIILTGSLTKTKFFISINNRIDLIEVVSNKKVNEICQVYLNDIIIHLRILRSNFPYFRTIILAEPNFIGVIRKCLIRNRVGFDRSRLCYFNNWSDTRLKKKLKGIDPEDSRRSFL